MKLLEDNDIDHQDEDDGDHVGEREDGGKAQASARPEICSGRFVTSTLH